MKQFILILSFTILTVNLFAQQLNIKSEDATRIKGKELIVITSGDELIDKYLKEAVELKWTFNRKISYMDTVASDELVKNHPNKYVQMRIQLIEAVIVYNSQNGIHNYSRTGRVYGDMMKINLYEDDVRLGKGFQTALPSNANFSRGIAIEAIQRMCYIINKIEKEGSWNKFYISTKKEGLPKLKDKTLLIPLENLENESDSTEMKEKYPYKISFVPTAYIHKKVEESDDDYAYLSVAEEIINVHVHYVCLAKDSEVLGHYHKSVILPSTLTSGGRHVLIAPKTFKKLFKKL